MNTFFTGDEHYGHLNVIRFCNRIDPSTEAQFADVNRHDAYLIDTHNAVVGTRDRVIHLGDFAYRCDPRRMRAILGRLNGAHFLVPGNHDGASALSLPWAAPPRDIMTFNVDGQRVVCCHYGLRTWPGIRRGAIHVFGHSHGKLPGNSMSCDVGVDCWDLRPVTLSEIRVRLAMLPPPADGEAADPEPDNDGVTP